MREDLTNEEIAYMAGLLDGHTSFYITIRDKVHQATMMITHYDYNLVSYLKENWGGYIEQRKNRQKCLESYHWRPVRKDMLKICNLCLPYMKSRIRHAELIIEFCKTVGEKGPFIDDCTREIREELKNELSQINNKRFKTKKQQESAHKTNIGFASKD